VLIDVLSNDATYGQQSLAALRRSAALGSLIVCPVVWAEIRGRFDDESLLDRAFAEAGIEFDPFDRECANLAGSYWREYRRRGGTRTRVIADFFIGAHAHVRGGRLLARDRGFYRRYFSSLDIIGEGA
jgi:predicted nucleic acid-binding protein